MKLLIDTDPGVDDALAIMMAHADAEVVGLTVAAGNVGLGNTVANTLRLVEMLGATTPVFAGCSIPLVQAAMDAAFVHGRDGFGDTGMAPSSRRAEEEHAVVAMLRLAREHAGELTLVMLGPLTHLALALRLDPELPSRIRRLVIMGGAVTGRGNTERVPAEFNIGFDAEAAHIVFSAWPSFELVDWELCVRHAIPFARFERLLEAGDHRARLYSAISRKALAFAKTKERSGVIVADALAMAIALEPGLVTQSETRAVSVELAGVQTRGATVVDWERRLGRAERARIVLDVRQSAYEARVARALGSLES